VKVKWGETGIGKRESGNGFVSDVFLKEMIWLYDMMRFIA